MAVFSGAGLACVRGGRLVFSKLDFTIGAGGALVLVGRNGCGKSSLLRLMAGLSRPAAGELLWHGQAVDDDTAAHHARLRYIGHRDAIKPILSVFENVDFWARFQGGRYDANSRAHAALDAFGLRRLADLPARYLSQGQRRRLALCRLLVSEVPLWLLDEPRAGLDDDAASQLDNAIMRHREQGGMVVIALHGSDRPAGSQVLDVGHYGGSS
ncbi:MAG: heme ABC exporter ATP-binding protein CcmA [Hyphomicrobiales bacterium]|nr:heme ABC exporter ATP-binding protein CcmA [Hyphomicrobiales bacterium]